MKISSPQDCTSVGPPFPFRIHFKWSHFLRFPFLFLRLQAATNRDWRVNREAWCKVSLLAIESSPRNFAPGSTNCSISAFRFPSPRQLLVSLKTSPMSSPDFEFLYRLDDILTSNNLYIFKIMLKNHEYSEIVSAKF